MNKKLLIALACAGCIFTGTGKAQISTSTASSQSTSEQWIRLATEKGIQVQALEFVNSGRHYLNLKFSNSNSVASTFAWQLTTKSGKLLASTASLKLAASASLSGSDDATINGGNMVILLEDGLTVNDLIVILKTL